MATMRYSVLLAGILAVTLGLAPLPEARAQTPPEYDELLPGQFPDCPRDVESRFPKCAIAMAVTTDEKWVACYCASNVKPADKPPFEPEAKRHTEATFEKLIPKGVSSPDPCTVLIVGGKRQYVCW